MSDMNGPAQASSFGGDRRSLPCAIAFVVGVALCANSAWAQFNVISKVRGRVKGTTCMHNLKEIGRALETYRADHRGKMPPSLKTLLPSLDKKLFVCPVSKKPKPDQSGWATSYTYVRGLSAKARGTAVVAYDSKPSNHGKQGRYVLFVDGSVKLLSEGEFRSVLKKAKRK